MRSNNPVFNNNPAFNGQAAYGQQAYPQGGYPPPPPGYGAPQYGAPQQATRAMTIDDVVQKTGVSLGVVLLAAAATWIGTGSLADEGDIATLSAITGVGAIVGLVVGLICSFKRSMLSPALVLVYAAAQGVFMGGVSKTYAAVYGGDIVVQAVIGTIFGAGGVLAVYKFFNVRLSDRFVKGFAALCLGFLGLGLLEMVLSFAGHPIGLFGNGGAGLLFAGAGLLIGLVGLMLDFDQVERAIASGVPEKFSWTAAFGLTASIVMVYFYLLRLLSILQQD